MKIMWKNNNENVEVSFILKLFQKIIKLMQASVSFLLIIMNFHTVKKKITKYLKIDLRKSSLKQLSVLVLDGISKFIHY